MDSAIRYSLRTQYEQRYSEWLLQAVDGSTPRAKSSPKQVFTDAQVAVPHACP
jgi:hypothetical protein